MAVTAAAYAAQLLALLPQGAAWRRAPGSVLSQLMTAIGEEFARLDARAESLLAEADPRSTAELLPEWETTAGLPDPCVDVPQTVEQRRAALLARLLATGGASRAYFIAVAAAHGYTVTIDEPALHTWRITASVSTAIVPFRAGLSTAGEPLRAFGDDALECLFNRIKPAHTAVLFAYAA